VIEVVTVAAILARFDVAWVSGLVLAAVEVFIHFCIFGSPLRLGRFQVPLRVEAFEAFLSHLRHHLLLLSSHHLA
jgi:hypothetical protein